jgi:hypothetical protein
MLTIFGHIIRSPLLTTNKGQFWSVFAKILVSAELSLDGGRQLLDPMLTIFGQILVRF